MKMRGATSFKLIFFASVMVVASTGIMRAATTSYYTVGLRHGLNLVGFSVEPRPNVVPELFRDLPEGSMVHQLFAGGYLTNTLGNGRVWTDPEAVVQFGDAVFVYYPASTPGAFSMGGAIQEGTLTRVVPAGLSAHAALIPKSGKITTDFSLALSPFDNFYLWSNGRLEVYTSLPGRGWHPSEPHLDLGSGFLVNASKPIEWTVVFQLTSPGGPGPAVSAISGGLAQGAVLAQAFASAQGTVNFANGALGVNAPARIGGEGITGPDWQAELLMRNMQGVFKVAGPIAFHSGSLAGYFFGRSVAIAGVAPGTSAQLQVRVFNAVANIEQLSNPVTVVLGGGKLPPANLVGLEPMSLTVVKLSIKKADDQVELSWPKAFSNFILESTIQIAPANWQMVTAERSVGDDTVLVRRPHEQSTEFFRLRSP